MKYSKLRILRGPSGFIGTVDQQCEVKSDAPICFINRHLECLITSEKREDFLSNIGSWR